VSDLVHPPDAHDDFAVVQEDDVVRSSVVMAVVGGGVVFMLLCCIIGFAASRAAEETYRPSGMFPERGLGAPHEVEGVEEILLGAESTWEGEGQAMRQEDRKELDSWLSLDRTRGLVRPPIDVVMQQMAADAQRGRGP
jgi:hypothetical protein